MQSVALRGERATTNSHECTRMRMAKTEVANANRVCFFVDSIFLGTGEEREGDGYSWLLQVLARNGR